MKKISSAEKLQQKSPDMFHHPWDNKKIIENQKKTCVSWKKRGKFGLAPFFKQEGTFLKLGIFTHKT